MWEIFIGSLVLSIIHASIPNHWIPLVAIGKTENWTQKESFTATLITGFSHTLSTVIIGVIVGFIGYKLSNNYNLISQTIAPAILVLLGIIYLVADIRNSHRHNHSHSHYHAEEIERQNKSKWAILFSLSVAMFFTPCIELEVYYFHAGTIGWTGIFIVSAVYTLTTVALMLIFVYLGNKGVQRLQSHYLEHHDKQITGIILILLGLTAYILRF